MSEQPHLTPKHREKLERQKAISPDVIAEAGYRSVRHDDPSLEMMGFAEYQWADGYLIPNSPPDASNGQYMLRRDQVRISVNRETGKRREIKMEQPEGQLHRLYVPMRCRPQLSDPSVVLHATEGNDKANALASQGACALSLPGVTIWRTPEILEKDWPHIELRGRTVLIYFDSKAETNPNVGGQRDRFAAFLLERGARPRIVRIPDNPDGSEQKIDDYLAKGGNLADLIAQHCEDWYGGTAQEVIEAQRAVIQRQREELEARAQLDRMPNTTLSAADRLAVWHATRAAYQARERDPEHAERQTVFLEEAVKHSGLSTDTVSKALDKVAALDKRRDYDKQGRTPHRVVTLLANMPTYTAAIGAIVNEAPVTTRNHGGKRERTCPNGCDMKLQVTTTSICTGCGEVVDEARCLVRPPRKPQVAVYGPERGVSSSPPIEVLVPQVAVYVAREVVSPQPQDAVYAEPPRCGDCQRPSPNSLTPCDVCIASPPPRTSAVEITEYLQSFCPMGAEVSS